MCREGLGTAAAWKIIKYILYDDLDSISSQFAGHVIYTIPKWCSDPLKPIKLYTIRERGISMNETIAHVLILTDINWNPLNIILYYFSLTRHVNNTITIHNKNAIWKFQEVQLMKFIVSNPWVARCTLRFSVRFRLSVRGGGGIAIVITK